MNKDKFIELHGVGTPDENLLRTAFLIYLRRSGLCKDDAQAEMNDCLYLVKQYFGLIPYTDISAKSYVDKWVEQ